MIKKNQNYLQIFINNINIACLRKKKYYDYISNLFKKRLMLKYMRNKNINYYDLTRFNKIETCKAETQLIYINYFDLYVFLFFLILIY